MEVGMGMAFEGIESLVDGLFDMGSNRSRATVLDLTVGSSLRLISRGALALFLLKLVMLTLFGTATSISCSENTQTMCNNVVT
jgi:hypothetical protein